MGAQIEGSLLGLGSHIWDVPPQNQGKMMIVRLDECRAGGPGITQG